MKNSGGISKARGDREGLNPGEGIWVSRLYLGKHLYEFG
jgi:hypothetical protein